MTMNTQGFNRVWFVLIKLVLLKINEIKTNEKEMIIQVLLKCSTKLSFMLIQGYIFPLLYSASSDLFKMLSIEYRYYLIAETI
jgi:hypothetical protein